jgi:hypothetical protein
VSPSLETFLFLPTLSGRECCPYEYADGLVYRLSVSAATMHEILQRSGWHQVDFIHACPRSPTASPLPCRASRVHRVRRRPGRSFPTAQTNPSTIGPKPPECGGSCLTSGLRKGYPKVTHHHQGTTGGRTTTQLLWGDILHIAKKIVKDWCRRGDLNPHELALTRPST